MSALEKAIPVPDELNGPYWEAAKQHRFVLQHCQTCGVWNARPRVICPVCHQDKFAWDEPSGRAKIHSYTIVHQTSAAGFQDEVPYVLCIATIEEDPTCYVQANLVVDKSEHDNLTVDLPLKIVFEDRGEVTVPQFELA